MAALRLVLGGTKGDSENLGLFTELGVGPEHLAPEVGCDLLGVHPHHVTRLPHLLGGQLFLGHKHAGELGSLDGVTGHPTLLVGFDGHALLLFTRRLA